MIKCITHGWKPRIDLSIIKAPYVVMSNYDSLTDFSESAAKEFEQMRRHKVVELVARAGGGLWNPMGATIKNSDKRRAQALGNITIVGNDSLRRASLLLEGQGLAPLKARLTHDCTASGLNGASLTPPFSYPSFASGLKMVTRGCWMAKTDIARYFHAFPLAMEVRDLFQLSYGEDLYRAMKCVFGFGPCPYYTSTWSAEYKT
jgi:hypothetical protein